MNNQILLYCYGTFLMICGIVSVIFIGVKAKTALVSGATSGLIAILIGYLISTGTNGAQVGGIILSVVLLIVFAWRSAKTLFRIFELIPIYSTTEELRGKGIAFLIISLMAVVSMFILIVQIASF